MVPIYTIDSLWPQVIPALEERHYGFCNPTTRCRNPQLVWETINAYQRTAALRAAIVLDMFTATGEGVNTVEPLAMHRVGPPRADSLRLLDHCKFPGQDWLDLLADSPPALSF
jgi:hypothetical protein